MKGWVPSEKKSQLGYTAVSGWDAKVMGNIRESQLNEIGSFYDR
jgi:hypothetical protein